MSRIRLFLAGASLGCALEYLFDPHLGRRRRALLRDGLIRSLRRMRIGIDKSSRDLRQRAHGLVCEIERSIAQDGVPDVVVKERVRSKLGRYASHPRAIEVSVHEGRVDLSGPVLAREAQPLCDAIRAIPGVRSVKSHLEAHPESEKLSALQGGHSAPGEHWNINEANWAPATRFGAALVGGLLVAYGTTRRFPVACVIGTSGLALLGMAISSGAAAPGHRGGRRDWQRTIHAGTGNSSSATI